MFQIGTKLKVQYGGYNISSQYRVITGVDGIHALWMTQTEQWISIYVWLLGKDVLSKTATCYINHNNKRERKCKAYQCLMISVGWVEG